MIYLDNHATTACDPHVVEAMLPFFTTAYGNPGSPHSLGQQAAEAVASARQQVAELLGAQAMEIVFTSGATEANNLAILGTARQHASSGGQRRRIIISAIEHKSVLEPCEHLASEGWDLVLLPVNTQGTIQWEEAEHLMNEETLLVSLQAANSEIGTIQDIGRMAQLAHKYGALLHCDAAQAVGKVTVNVETWKVDLLSLSAHKLYGPKGVGVLYVSGGRQNTPIMPLTWGGSQEYGFRPGTVPVPLIVGLGKAAEIAKTVLFDEQKRLTQLRDKLEALISESLSNITFNGCIENRLPHNSSITFNGIDAEAILLSLTDVIVSTGAACESGSIAPSRVLLAIGLSDDAAYCTIRIGLGRFTEESDVYASIKQIINTVQRIV